MQELLRSLWQGRFKMSDRGWQDGFHRAAIQETEQQMRETPEGHQALKEFYIRDFPQLLVIEDEQ